MIRDTFLPELDEFIGDLESYATGSYLSEEERENWFAPYDASALPELRGIVLRYFEALDGLAALHASRPATPATAHGGAGNAGGADGAEGEPDPAQASLLAAVDNVTAEIHRLDDAHDGALLETDELETLAPLILRAATAAGLREAGAVAS